MKKSTSLIIGIILFSFPAIAQFNDFDIDSIHFVSYQEGDSINGQLYEIRVMEYLSPLIRNTYHDSIANGERYSFSESYLEINTAGKTVNSSSNTLSSPNNPDNSYTAIYEDENLVESENIYFSEDPWNYGENISRTLYEFYDEYGNYTEREVYGNEGNDTPVNLQFTFLHNHYYTNGNLDSTIISRLNNLNGGLDNHSERHFQYNSENQLIDYEYYYYSYYGIKEILQKLQYFYLNDGTLDYSISYSGNYLTEDPLDFDPAWKTKYIYDTIERITERQSFRYADDENYDLNRIIYFYRNNTTSIEKTHSLASEININSTSDINQVFVAIDGLDKLKKYNIQVLNESGTRVKQTSINGMENWSESFSLNAGIYFLNVQSSGGIQTTKSIVVY